MNINTICRKLAKYNKSQYIMLTSCLIFGICLVTSLGQIVFSSMLKDNTVSGGTTRSIAYITFGATMVGSVLFIMYSHALFMKYKSTDIGLFISLGMSRKSIEKIFLKELSYILPFGIILGIITGCVMSFINWYIITSVLGISKVAYEFGVEGIISAILTGCLIIIFLKLKTSRYIKKVDIMTIIKCEEKHEENRTGKYIYGILGLIIAPLGFWLWNKKLLGLLFNNIQGLGILFAIMGISGIYLIVSQIGVFGDVLKKISIQKYYKNIIFCNLLKLKGRQYTSTLLVSIILIAITIFMSSIALIGPLAAEEIIETRYPFDYSIRKTIDQNQRFDKDVIYRLADENDTNIINYKEFELLKLAFEWSFGNIKEMMEMVCISESEYNRVYNDDIDVKPSYYIMYSNNKSRLQLKGLQKLDATVVGSKIVKQLKMQDGIQKILVEGYVSTRGEFFVLDEKDYLGLKEHSLKEAVETVIVFDVSNWKDTGEFYKSLKDYMLKNNKKGLKVRGELIDTIYNEIPEEFVSHEDISYRQYEYYKYRLEGKIAGFVEEEYKSIYAILFLYIGILSIVASSVIIYIKVLNISWQDIKIYKNITLLGSNRKAIKSIISKQLIVVFFLPTLIGSSLGLFFSNMMNWQYLHNMIFFKYSLVIVFAFIVVQLCMFLFTRFILIKNQTNYSL